jgi:hypothetical protein
VQTSWNAQKRTAPIEFDGTLQRDHLGDVVLRLRSCVLLHCGIEVGHVRLVVLLVVHLGTPNDVSAKLMRYGCTAVT